MGGSLGGDGTLEDATMSAVLREWTFSGENSSSNPNGLPHESLMAIDSTASVESDSVSLTRYLIHTHLICVAHEYGRTVDSLAQSKGGADGFWDRDFSNLHAK